MFKRTGVVVGSGLLLLIAVFFVADRSISELYGYFQAGASTTVNSIEDDLIPDTIHDEKTELEINSAREQLVDRQVQLNLSLNQLKTLEYEIQELEKVTRERANVLASAYPVLQQGVTSEQNEIEFLTSRFSLAEFQHEVDELLSMQERDDNTLAIKRDCYKRLKDSVASGQAALAEMKNELLSIQQEFTVLQTRRDQARLESETLDLVAGATSNNDSTTAGISLSIGRLEGQVQELEARNEARRAVSSVNANQNPGRLTETFNRLEALKSYADGAEAPAGDLTASEKIATSN